MNIPVDHSSSVLPPAYHCHTCKAHGCKLWREYQTCADYTILQCAECAAKDHEKNISDMDKDGRYTGKYGIKGDQIGWMIPAIPTVEGDTFWGYTSVPQAGCNWWYRLPNKV